jgi:oxysterol-binding protein-related protein 8
VRQYESNYRIQTKTRHQTPIVRTASIVSADPLSIAFKTESRTSLAARRALSSIQSAAAAAVVSAVSSPSDVNSDSSGDNEIIAARSK